LPSAVEAPPATQWRQEACSHLRVDSVQCKRLLRMEIVTGAIGCMITKLIASRESADQSPYPIGLPQRKSRMRHEALYLIQGVRQRGNRLQHEPLIQNQGLCRKAELEV